MSEGCLIGGHRLPASAETLQTLRPTAACTASNEPHAKQEAPWRELARSVRDRAERSQTRVVETAAIHVEASRSDPERLALVLPGADALVAPTQWSFGQLASQVGAPAAYLRQLPAALAAINLQYGLTAHRAEQIKTLEIEDGRVELRAVTGPDYGRIYDHELVEAVQRIAGKGGWASPTTRNTPACCGSPTIRPRRSASCRSPRS